MAHLAQVREIATPLGIAWACMTPSWSRSQIPACRRSPPDHDQLHAKGRPYFDMMYRPAQCRPISTCPKPVGQKLWVSVALQPVATALFANSPFTEGVQRRFVARSGNLALIPTVPAPMIPKRSRTVGLRALGRLRRRPCTSSARRQLYRRRRLLVPGVFGEGTIRFGRAADAVGLGQPPPRFSPK